MQADRDYIQPERLGNIECPLVESPDAAIHCPGALREYYYRISPGDQVPDFVHILFQPLGDRMAFRLVQQVAVERIVPNPVIGCENQLGMHQ